MPFRSKRLWAEKKDYWITINLYLRDCAQSHRKIEWIAHEKIGSARRI